MSIDFFIYSWQFLHLNDVVMFELDNFSVQPQGHKKLVQPSAYVVGSLLKPKKNYIPCSDKDNKKTIKTEIELYLAVCRNPHKLFNIHGWTRSK